MDIRLLGSVTVHNDGKPVPKRSDNAFRLLVLLLTSPNCTADHETIQRTLWPAKTSKDNIRQTMRTLRDRFPDHVPHNPPNSCTVAFPTHAVDLLRFREKATRARGLPPADRARVLATALSEWADEGPLHGLGAEFAPVRAALVAEWRHAWADYLEALLDNGESERVLHEYRVVSARWPDDERLFHIHLAAHADLYPDDEESRRHQTDEWARKYGASPDGPTGRPYGLLTRRVVPRQLPRALPTVAGRRRELAALSDQLIADGGGTGGLVVLSGMPGVGKSALAVHWATTVQDRFPDGTLYADLHGYTWASVPTITVEHVLARFLTALGVTSIPATLDAKTATYRSVLAGRAVLVVLDNARSAEQVRRLLPGGVPSATLVTSRDVLHGLAIRDGATDMRLAPLTREEAADLLRTGLASSHPRADPHCLDELADLCGRLPLALAVTAARLRGRPDVSLRDHLAKLRKDRRLLDELEIRDGDADLSMRLALRSSYASLSAAARRLCWQLAVHSGPSIGWTALVDLGRVGGDGDTGARAADELLSASLLECHGGRYVLHDLVRLFGQEVSRDADQALKERTTERALDHLLHNVWACDQVLDPHRRLPVGPAGDHSVVAPDSETEAMAWLAAEYETVKAAVLFACDTGAHRHTWLLAMALTTFQWRRNLHADAVAMARDALPAVREVGGPEDEAMVLRMLAGSHRGVGAHALARSVLLDAVRVSARADPAGVSLAQSLRSLGVLHLDLGERAEADDCFRRALVLFRDAGHLLGTAEALHGIGAVHLENGDHAAAGRACEEALDLFGSTTDRNGRASVLVTLAEIHLGHGEREAAAARFASAAAVYRDLGYWRNEVRTLRSLADLLIGSGDRDGAAEALERAHALLRDELNDAAAADRVGTVLRGLR